jgi:hypothetical protein
MIIHKITDLVNHVAEVLSLPPDTISQVIGHTLSYTKDYIENPTKPGLRLKYFGVIRPDSKSLTVFLKKLIKHLRDPTLSHLHPQIKEEFARFWKLRKLLQEDNERRNFKRRFGS